MLQTSLNRFINELTLKFLGSVLTLPGFEDRIFMDCLNVLISCVSVGDDRVVVTRGSEQLAEMAATRLLGSLPHRLVEQPVSGIPKDVHQRYKSVFPSLDKLHSLSFRHTIAATRSLIVDVSPDHTDWNGVDPSTPGSLQLVHNFVKIAWYQRKFGTESRRVPDWILCFSLHFLLWDPKPPLSVVVDCLSIAAIDLGCKIP